MSSHSVAADVARSAVSHDHVVRQPLRKVGETRLYIESSRPTKIVGSFASGHNVTLTVGPGKRNEPLQPWHTAEVKVDGGQVQLGSFEADMEAAILRRT